MICVVNIPIGVYRGFPTRGRRSGLDSVLDPGHIGARRAAAGGTR